MQLGEGNDAGIELKARDSINGRTQTFTVSTAGVDSVERGDGYADLEASPETLEAYQAFEAARGVPLHDMLARLQRLLKGAEAWHKHNP
ncbi:hypothetical protein [Verminephrobacter eiseniae]|uniref:Uncharacterized protein n=1 Tax=Verminephrobacter eiseniae (strain EF01-2) TaxID=391735 RepID=A1WSX0_VEREI|nr:hypothetical protein [Verminephrobacter eiseniae]ABM60727.1 hypothetical protein Veis_5041 [Verminephrobacter eiseniae EF01-2]MCW5287481.1 hypothetical protein [Verminephrobacter eiseniae]MCW5305774.1 hypothetical protein [Verminephrobacter eiseniae]MCW8179378.1 hypothetical protein [Verminephrobacter eiseniae]MCW8191735.1 hypothetical protein [Verminephrobacter eiseniae]